MNCENLTNGITKKEKDALIIGESILKKVNFNLDLLKNHGFVICSRGHSTNRAYHHRELNIVIKNNFIVCKDTTLPKMPMLSVYYDGEWYRIQIYSKRERLHVAAKILKEMNDRKKIVGDDIRKANVGWYKNKPVLIDW